MSKAVLISIQPKWVEKIANGEKTIEVRKSVPKLERPFKVYIYNTYGNAKENYCVGKRGKVIGEFVCDRIDKYTAEFVNDGECYEDIRRVWLDEDGEDDFEIVTGNDRDNPEDCELLKNSCLSYAELKKYIGENFHDIPFYAWHISDLKIYDKPKELSEFKRYCFQYGKVDCHECMQWGQKNIFCLRQPIKRPPQSWCYVEELQNG